MGGSSHGGARAALIREASNDNRDGHATASPRSSRSRFRGSRRASRRSRVARRARARAAASPRRDPVRGCGGLYADARGRRARDDPIAGRSARANRRERLEAPRPRGRRSGRQPARRVPLRARRRALRRRSAARARRSRGRVARGAAPVVSDRTTPGRRRRRGRSHLRRWRKHRRSAAGTRGARRDLSLERDPRKRPGPARSAVPRSRRAVAQELSAVRTRVPSRRARFDPSRRRPSGAAGSPIARRAALRQRERRRRAGILRRWDE